MALDLRQNTLSRATGMVPNLFTVANMALGFFAIKSAMDYKWIVASVCIFVAHIMDILDGRVARWMGLTSQFGGQFDSFADWISFGIAPSLMVYLLALKDFGKWGFLLSFFFVLCGALRLTRFNLHANEPKTSANSNFSGLPIPGAGGFLAIIVLLCGLSERGQRGRTMFLLYQSIPALKQAIPIIVFSLALLMISKVEYAGFKKTKLFRPQSLRALIMTLFVCFMIYAYPENTIFFLYSGYILWGVINTGLRAYRLRSRPAENFPR